MKILESQSATLTNHEVLTHLHALSARRSQSTAAPQPQAPSTSSKPLKSPNFETITKELTDYLSTPAPAIPTYAPPFYTTTTTRTLLERLKPYKLTKAELLMVLNLRPRDLGLLDCVVEECDERFSEGEQEGILRVVAEVLGGEGVDGIGERVEERAG